MQTFLSENHRRHFPKVELSGGQLVIPFERPARVDHIVQRLAERKFSAPRDPGPVDLRPARALLDPGYLTFLETAWDAWKAAGNAGEIIATNVPARRMATARRPEHIEGLVGWYAHASETAMTRGTWAAACASLACAQAGARAIRGGAASAFALCRPPGHHATADQYGGYCFINNAAVAAQMLRDAGAARVAILDIDFHHGNGTQDIFYDRDDVLFCSLHGAPEHTYPWFTGYADDAGSGSGAGFTRNYPMPPGTGYDRWGSALDETIRHIRGYGPDTLVVSLGVDAYKDDPIGFFTLDSPDFTDTGARIAALGLPTLFVMEGGYAVEQVGINTVNLLEGFLGG